MEHSPNPIRRSRDESSFHYDLSNAVYGAFPSRASSTSPQSSRDPSPGSKGPSKKQKLVGISLTRNNARPSWLPPQPIHRSSPLQNEQCCMDFQQNVYLNFNMAANGDISEPDLWILPDFDDWEVETKQEGPASVAAAAVREVELAPLLRRAAISNLERLRTRLEGDGWDFVGGRYGDSKRTLQEAASHSINGEFDGIVLDDEFDVVVLPAVKVQLGA
ncbi:hypothetical protein EJ02DRAFT_207251 [Clathrospora elynae]|uniref:Uncharacterized protein n=1 Tax=Clathrospora elynae TaxID=706981 RepID=A0A6A5SM78_9PLEO|nr:hypothetical protein EJ02DRAFT_207251 [Clathrospora elynae]